MSFEKQVDQAFAREVARDILNGKPEAETAVEPVVALWAMERNFAESLQARLAGADIVINHNPDGGTAQALIHLPPSKTSTLPDRARVVDAAVDAGWEVVHAFSFATARNCVVLVTVK